MIQGKSVLAIITARGGSKGVSRKNILPIGGKPLIQWTIDAASASKYIDRLILSSDDPEIMTVAAEGGCDIPFRRTPELADDSVSSIEVVVDALNRVPGFDIALLLQPTSPLRNVSDIDEALECMLAEGAPACVSLRAAADHPYWTFRLASTGRLVHYASPDLDLPLRRQDLPAAWCLNGAIYAAQTEWFLRERTFLSEQTIGYPMPAERSLDIDTQEDIQRFRFLVESANYLSACGGNPR